MSEREFDLNIEKILENWEVYHAVREIIANALDEQILTKTKDISIYKDESGCWHIVDYGRGLNYRHLTQNENEEKLKNGHLIGRFGVGLKDALATLYRNDVNVRISSKYGVITLKQSSKADFDDIKTLHAVISDPENDKMVGTDVCLENCDDKSINKAKSLFLKFSGAKILEETPYGSVIKNKLYRGGDIYINGVKVADEPNFLFSYNITSLTTKLRKALNRERSNVGRSAYTDRVKSILLECTSKDVISDLIYDMRMFEVGTSHDEVGWVDVQLYACNQIMKSNPKVVFVTADDLKDKRSTIDSMEQGGDNVIVIPTALQRRMDQENSFSDDWVFNTTTQYSKKEEANFNPVVINIDNLTDEEKAVYAKTNDILELIGGKPKKVKSIEITEKLFKSNFGLSDLVLGLWQPDKGRILIKRTQLKSLEDYAGTLLHECLHALSGYDDVSREFEIELTRKIGSLAAKLLS